MRTKCQHDYMNDMTLFLVIFNCSLHDAPVRSAVPYMSVWQVALVSELAGLRVVDCRALSADIRICYCAM